MTTPPINESDLERKFTRSVFERFESNDIQYAVLRGFEGLPNQVTHDIDMGVRSTDFTAMAQCIHRVARETKCLVVRDRRKAGFRQIYVLCDSRIIKLDLWCTLALHGVPYLDMNRVLDTRRAFNGLWVLPPETEALVTAFKEILHNATISARKAATILEKSVSPPVSVDLGCPKECIHDVWTFLERAKHPTSAVSLRRRILATVRPGGLAGKWSRVRFLSTHLRDRVRPFGRFVVLLGPDGSGKTTLSRHLMEEIDHRAGLNGRYCYLHGRFGVLPNLGRLQGRSDRSGTMTLGFEMRRDAERIHGRAQVLIYLVYYFWDFLLGHILLQKSARKDTLTIADRYFYDYFLQPMYSNYPKPVKSLYLWLLPRPHKVIFLKADPEAIVARKPELTAAEIDTQQKKIEALLEHPTLRKRSFTLFTDIDQEATKASLRRQVYT